MNALLQKIGIRLPIVQAPMAGVSTPAMAAAVSNSGALGSIGVGAVDAVKARDMIRAIRAATDRPFNVNVFTHQPAAPDAAMEAAWIAKLGPYFAEFGATAPHALKEIYTSFTVDDEMLAMLLEEKPPVVSFHFGLPSPAKIAALRDAGIVLLATATNLAEAKQIDAAGVDAIVAQGFEAGGHRGMFDPDARDECLDTFALTRLLVENVRIPVIAAGGIMNGAGIAAVMKLGAAAAQLGTAFVACPESSADAGFRAALLSSASAHTTMTRAISGRLARSIVNRFTALGESVDPKTIPAYPIAYDAGKALHQAAQKKGEWGFGAQWAGQAARLARMMPTGELVRLLEREMNSALER